MHVRLKELKENQCVCYSIYIAAIYISEIAFCYHHYCFMVFFCRFSV